MSSTLLASSENVSAAEHRDAPDSTVDGEIGPGDLDLPAFAAFYRDHHGFVWRTARRLGVAEPNLEDVVQDVFLVAARRLAEFRGRSLHTTWLFAITLNATRTHLRTHARHRRRLEAVAVTATRATPGEAERYEAAQTLYGLLDHLDEDKRAAFVLAELERMTAVEIAEAVGANVNTIYTRLRAAWRILRDAAAGSRGRAEVG